MLGGARKTMKASKFTESQIAFVLKQGDEGTPVAEICRKAMERDPARRYATAGEMATCVAKIAAYESQRLATKPWLAHTMVGQ